jgi:prepilin-type processing-associated H-X9-DG protein
MRAATKKRVESPFEGMNCPSRRRTNVYPFQSFTLTFALTDPFEVCSKTDYAANAGDMVSPELNGGPVATGSDNYETVRKTHNWEGFGSATYSQYQGENKATGVVFGRSEISFRQIVDGTAKTYMVGEKFMSTDEYDTGLDYGDNEPAFSGNNTDTLRTTCNHRGPRGPLLLRPDQPGSSDDGLNGGKATNPGYGGELIFGSAHSGGFNMAFCDSSVTLITFDVDPEVHRARGHRADGVITDGQ